MLGQEDTLKRRGLGWLPTLDTFRTFLFQEPLARPKLELHKLPDLIGPASLAEPPSGVGTHSGHVSNSASTPEYCVARARQTRETHQEITNEENQHPV